VLLLVGFSTIKFQLKMDSLFDLPSFDGASTFQGTMGTKLLYGSSEQAVGYFCLCVVGSAALLPL
jgi:hypothetical protein